MQEPPILPQPPASPRIRIGQDGTVMRMPPRTAEEVANLRAQRSELSSQLRSVESRRKELTRELRQAEGATRAGLEQRISLLDERILRLESEIAQTGQLLAMAPSGLVATTRPARDRDMDDGTIVALGSVLTIFVLAPLAFAAARLLWKRATSPPPRGLTETAQRLQRLEEAVDTIAVEVERISEGQRFMTRLLADSQGISVLSPTRREGAPVLRGAEGSAGGESGERQ